MTTTNIQPFEFNPQGQSSGLESFLDQTHLDIHLAGTVMHVTTLPTDRRNEQIPSYTLWFVRDATYHIETPTRCGDFNIDGGVLFRPGSFYARLIAPQSAPMLYVRLNAKLFGTLDLFQLFGFPELFSLPERSLAQKNALKAIDEYKTGLSASRLAGYGLFIQAFAWLLREVFGDELPEQSVDPFVLKAVRYIRDYAGDALRIGDIAEELGCHPSHLSRRFQAELGRSPAEFLRLIRINRAKELLLSTDLSVREIGDLVGYPDPSHFSRVFLQEVGMRPSIFRSTTHLGG